MFAVLLAGEFNTLQSQPRDCAGNMSQKLPNAAYNCASGFTSRPTDLSTKAVTPYAFNAAASGGTYQQLFSAPAGSWPNLDGNANVPVVANGKVYVASAFLDASKNTRGQLAIFGVFGVPPSPYHPVKFSSGPWPDAPHVITGTLLAASGSTLTLQTRTGKSITIDASKALSPTFSTGAADERFSSSLR